MKKFFSIILVLLLSLLVFAFFYTPNKSEYDQTCVLGMGEVMLYDEDSETGLPTRADIDKRIKMMADLNVKSHRFWLRVGRNAIATKKNCLFVIENNELKLNDSFYNECKYVLQKLKYNEITHITMNACWMYGKKANGEWKYYGGDVPTIGTEDYKAYMESLTYQHKWIAELFPEVKYFELGNEMNYGFLSQNGEERFSNEEKAKIVLDYSYYANKGIKEGNKKAKSVLNGLAEGGYYYNNITQVYVEETGGCDYIRSFLDLLYTDIESGEYPTIADEKTTKVENYFEVLAWHPYSCTSLYEWVYCNNDIYDVVKKHNDDGRPVFITEFGIKKPDEEAGDVYVEIINNISKTPYIEAVHLFILSDYEWCRNDEINEKTFCLSYYDKASGEYTLTEAYLRLKEAFDKKGE